MERRVLAAVVLSFLVLVAYQFLFPPPPDQPKPKPADDDPADIEPEFAEDVDPAVAESDGI